jgi:putative membrane protein insertion efficiency factor
MKKIMLTTVGFYRNWISPALPGSCRFAPTCSTYAQQALEHHGAWKGASLTAKRLLRCHPFHPGGYDPVPKRAPHSKFKIQHSRNDTDYIWNMPFDKAQGPEPVEGESGIWNSSEINRTTQRNEHHG